MLIWLPIRAYFHPGTDEVLKYLPHVEMTLTVDLANAADVTPQSSGQTLTGVSEAAEENGDSSYTVAGWLETSGDKTQSEPVGRSQELKGILLSHDSAYWYVLSQEDPYKCMIVAIPVDKASEIRFPSPQISAPPGNRSVGCQT
jgi:hypothetical protein